MLLSADNLQAITLTLKVAALTTAILLVLGTPLAWWLASTSRWRTALPWGWSCNAGCCRTSSTSWCPKRTALRVRT